MSHRGQFHIAHFSNKGEQCGTVPGGLHKKVPS